MIRDGLFEKFPMEAIFGAHNWPGMQVGQFAIKSGPCFASSNEFKVTIHGKGGHAAMPHNGIDPVPVACRWCRHGRPSFRATSGPSTPA
jgi:hippurate hydrolase